MQRRTMFYQRFVNRIKGSIIIVSPLNITWPVFTVNFNIFFIILLFFEHLGDSCLQSLDAHFYFRIGCLKCFTYWLIVVWINLGKRESWEAQLTWEISSLGSIEAVYQWQWKMPHQWRPQAPKQTIFSNVNKTPSVFPKDQKSNYTMMEYKATYYSRHTTTKY